LELTGVDGGAVDVELAGAKELLVSRVQAVLANVSAPDLE
jgi:hypothetical protein